MEYLAALLPAPSSSSREDLAILVTLSFVDWSEVSQRAIDSTSAGAGAGTGAGAGGDGDASTSVRLSIAVAEVQRKHHGILNTALDCLLRAASTSQATRAALGYQRRLLEWRAAGLSPFTPSSLPSPQDDTSDSPHIRSRVPLQKDGHWHGHGIGMGMGRVRAWCS